MDPEPEVSLVGLVVYAVRGEGGRESVESKVVGVRREKAGFGAGLGRGHELTSPVNCVHQPLSCPCSVHIGRYSLVTDGVHYWCSLAFPTTTF